MGYPIPSPGLNQPSPRFGRGGEEEKPTLAKKRDVEVVACGCWQLSRWQEIKDDDQTEKGLGGASPDGAKVTRNAVGPNTKIV